MKQKRFYQTPATDVATMTNESVMAASVDNIVPGKRYDSGDDLTSPATGGGIPLGMGGGGTGSLLKMGRQLLPLLALGLMTASCSNEAEAPVPDEPTTGDTTPFTITAGIGGVSTRTDYTEGTNAENTADMLNVVWGTGETLQALSFGGGAGGDYSLTTTELTGVGDGGTKSMSFTGSTPPANVDGIWGAAHHYYYDYGKKGKIIPNPDYAFLQFDLRGQVYNVTDPLANLKNYDIMYTTTATDGSSITLEHACAVIRFNLRLNSVGQAIDSITMSADADVFNSRLHLYYDSDGSFSKDGFPYTSNEVISLKIQNDDKSSDLDKERTLEAYLMMPAPDAGIDISGRLIKVSAIAADGTVYSRILDLTGATNEKLMAGACYTFFGDDGTTRMAEDRWAGSNIYRGSDGNFAFAAPNDMSKVKYQGLFFKWGSLTGVAPTSTGVENGGANYITYTHGVSGSATTADWSTIDYYGNDASETDALVPADDDICIAISNDTYRLPTKDEMYALLNSVTTTPHVGDWRYIESPSETVSADGTYPIPNGTLVGNVFLPASGGAADYAVFAGSDVNYWSSTANETDNTLAYSFYDGSKRVIELRSDYGKAEFAFSIRCIKKTETTSRD
jgi:uncharacterized protein (TIGR02145 family)